MSEAYEHIFNVLKNKPAKSAARTDSFFAPIKEALHLMYKGETVAARIVICQLLQSGLSAIEEKKKIDLPLYFLLISEIPSIPEELRSFSLDAMLYTEGSYQGEIKDIKGFKEELFKIQNPIS